jgi:hypothetical protein
LTISEGMVRRDAHWAPFETADMTLLPTWTPSGDGERRLSGRAWTRTRGYPGSGGGKGAGDRSSVSAAIDRRWGTPCADHSGRHRKGMLPTERGVTCASHRNGAGAHRKRSCLRGVGGRPALRAGASRGSSGAPRRPADSSIRRGSARSGSVPRTARTPHRATPRAARHRQGGCSGRGLRR